ncbi:MAG: ABC transporter permease subunit [Armatimonadota bacterium]|nr:ABC transporter permease subunit [Armatimonadota bacterium]
MRITRLFRVEQPAERPFTWGDVIVLLVIITLIYAGVRLAYNAPPAVRGPEISLAPGTLPWYTFRSLGRMAAAYALSMAFSLVYGYLAAYSRRAEQMLLPLLDVLQSVPILSFLPVVLLSFSAILPQAIAAEFAAIVLIFTSQVWNITFAWYQSLTTIPKELREVSDVFRLGWLRLRTLELPFAAISLIWNSMMGWAGGWFFLMAAEIFTVGDRDFRLPGLGAYLQAAANRGDLRAVGFGIGTLVVLIVVLDQLVWRPLLAWSDRFKLEMVENRTPPTSWFYDAWRTSRMAHWLGARVAYQVLEAAEGWIGRRLAVTVASSSGSRAGRWGWYAALALGAAGLLYGSARAVEVLLRIPPGQWAAIGVGLIATLLRVTAALAIALAWTVPLGVAIGSSPRLATWLQPVIQVTASVPATALFPVFVLALAALPAGLNLAAVLLMLMGTQWYLLFNIIAGASAIPQDLKYTSALLQLDRRERWRTLVLPALFPYIITGAITASGGAWNASIVAEYIEFGGRTLSTVGIGALISHATASGDYPLLLAATLAMVATVVTVNRLVWRRLYGVAAERYRME